MTIEHRVDREVCNAKDTGIFSKRRARRT